MLNHLTKLTPLLFLESGDSRAIASSVATKNNKRITDQYLSSKQPYYEFKLSWLFLVKISSYTFIFEKNLTFSNLGECLLSQNTFSSVSFSNLLNFIKSFFVWSSLETVLHEVYPRLYTEEYRFVTIEKALIRKLRSHEVNFEN